MATDKEPIEALEIPLSKIESDPNQPRQSIGDLTDLVASIKAQGVIQPIIVTRFAKDRYRIIAGHRRFNASCQLQLTSIPAIVRTVKSARDLAAIQLIENLQRKDLDPFDEAVAMNALIEKHGMKQKALAVELGMSPAAVNQKLRVLSIPEPLRKAIQTSEREVSQSTLLEIAKQNDTREQWKMWKRLEESGDATVRAAKSARRGSYAKRYEEFTEEVGGVKIMVRWRMGGGQTERRDALKKAQKLIEQELENLNS